ncbi:AAA domain (dynein-related subfamily) [Clostridium acidisoli DSM 12555]|uniref:AAA domain (Dynein-related subfamily) n=1 Tax=Clostridium acidisoli DSM 12555 TaxID=1121291 RepID=A0A1W1X4Q1_9CLOT|nr:AAA family ATPase [Clostridium acidisoli]SMC18783.1 AAA domain (dynein-related subfamily) [Clostridium acidisoli DSM 12555]
MNFNDSMRIICEVLNNQDMTIIPNNYDGIIVKKLEASNTLDAGRTTNQTHIAITGAQMDIFPYLKAEGYFSKDYEEQDNELKKYFITQIPVFLNKINIDYLNGKELNDVINFNNSNQKRVLTSVVRARRKNQADQLQMSLINFDSQEFVLFRKMIHSGDYLIVLKRKEILEYEFYGVKKADIDANIGSLNDLNNIFVKLSTNTRVDISALQVSYNNVIEPHNRIIFGAPGTGKSYKLNEDRKKFFKDKYERVTFHPNYSYAQFVGNYKPKPKFRIDGTEYVSYEFVPGPFLRTWIKAQNSIKNDENANYLLIIEEINRANVAAVFGDIFQLLDRSMDGTSEYEIATSEDMREYLIKEGGFAADEVATIRIPNNMYIWATMNSADQGVLPMDSAFKRRWNFEYLGINEASSKIKDTEITLKPYGTIKWDMLRISINNALIEADVNEDKLIGSFFLSDKELKSSSIDEIFKSKLLMYLFEDVLKHRKGKLFKSELNTFSKIIEAYNKSEEIFDFDVISVLPNDADEESALSSAAEDAGKYSTGNE